MSNGNGGNTSATNLAQISFEPKRVGDCVADATMTELVRRIIVTTEPEDNGSIVYSVTPPANKNAIWVPIDTNGNRTGPNKRYDYDQSRWETDIQGFNEFASNTEDVRNLLVAIGDTWSARDLLRESFTLTVSGNGDTAFTIGESIDDANYSVFITPTNNPADTKVYLKTKGNQTFTLTAVGHVSGSQTFSVTVIQLNNS